PPPQEEEVPAVNLHGKSVDASDASRKRGFSGPGEDDDDDDARLAPPLSTVPLRGLDFLDEEPPVSLEDDDDTTLHAKETSSSVPTPTSSDVTSDVPPHTVSRQFTIGTAGEEGTPPTL